MTHVQMEEPKMELAILLKNAVIAEEPMMERALKDMACAAHVSQATKVSKSHKIGTFCLSFSHVRMWLNHFRKLHVL